MKIKLQADMIDENMKQIKMAGKVFTIKKKKTVTRTLGYYFDYKGKTLFVPKNCATEIK